LGQHKVLRPLGEIGKRASISHSGGSFYACSETVIELERTIKPSPGFPGAGFLFWPERPAFGHRWLETRWHWQRGWFNYYLLAVHFWKGKFCMPLYLFLLCSKTFLVQSLNFIFLALYRS